MRERGEFWGSETSNACESEREREILMSGRVRESSIAKEKESKLESETKREKKIKDSKRLRE